MTIDHESTDTKEYLFSLGISNKRIESKGKY